MKLNLPCKITISRMILIPLVIFFYLANFIPNGIGKFIAAGIFMLAAYTDHLDGHLARKNNQVTNLGKFLDPIADKLLVYAALILMCVDATITHQFAFAQLVLIIMISRDFIVDVLRQVGASNNKIISADKCGKLKTVLQDIALSILIVYSALKSISMTGLFVDILKWAGHITIGLAALVAIISCVNYIVKNKEVFKG
ncbi:MAG: CDP-diacylglycerol--glycerol-3-phosphate 3-phosphatidyltransferase [Clostridiales bacterium]|nr:CDP-diacylglycerol--glycerol-3-phosphate 3-phosphatidyltransferase [Clostridiales bacterium]